MEVGAAPELLRVVHNLLVNAVRHTPAGGAVRLASGEHGQNVWVRIEDGCGGIPQADLDRVFDMGYRGSVARESDTGSGRPGAGMGLAIARGLLDAQDGTIAVTNHADGCRFEIRLPAA